MKRRYFIVVGTNRFAEEFISCVQRKLQERGSPVKVLQPAVNAKLNGCRVLEIPADHLYTKSSELDAIGTPIVEWLDGTGWLDDVCNAIVYDCKRLGRTELEINFVIISRCRHKKMPGFVFYWKARSKRF